MIVSNQNSSSSTFPSAASKKIAFSIPVKPYLAKYLLLRCGADFQVNRKTAIGSILIGILGRNKERLDYKLTEAYSSSFMISLQPDLVFNRGVRHFSTYGIVSFNSAVDELFKSEFYCYMSIALKYSSMDINKCILAFMDSMDLQEEDIRLEALKKSYYRYRTTKTNQMVGNGLHVLSSITSTLNSSISPQ